MCIINSNNKELVLYIADSIKNFAIMITDEEGKIEYVNEYFTKLYGYTKKELIGKTPSILKSGYHPQDYYKTMWETIKSGNYFESKIINKKKNGEIIHCIVNIYPVKNNNDEIVGYISIYIDITYYSFIENKFVTLTDSLPDIFIILLNSNGEIIDAKPAKAEEIFYKIIGDTVNLETHINILNIIDSEEKKGKYKAEYTVEIEGEAKVYLATYSRFNLNKYILVLNEITDTKLRLLKDIYEQNIQKLYGILNND